jgi:hypothetical protein
MRTAQSFTADPDADLDRALVDGRRMRKRHRIGDIDWIDAVYRAELTGVACAIAFYALAGLIGDSPVTPAQMATVASDGDAWLALAAALAMAVGLRSGCRGGPLVLEQAEVRHVLLSPVDRGRALRGPALRQFRFLAFVALTGGAAIGFLAAHRLSGSTGAWVASAAIFALTTTAMAFGLALLAAAARLPSWAGTGLGAVLVALAAGHVLGVVGWSPTVPWGRIGLWPEQPTWPGLIALVVSAGALGVGLAAVGRVSVESAERRSTLVGQLRFAATLQDVRTVIVLRRQLALELPRLRPWVRVPVTGTERLPVWHRGLRGVLRWPAARVGRLIALGVVTGLALRGVASGTTPLLALAAAALFLAGVDAAESISQDLDHPSLAGSTPVDPGALRVRHLGVAAAVMAAVVVIGGISAVLVAPSAVAAAVAVACAPAAAMGGLAGAAASLLSSPDQMEALLMPPEVTGAFQAFRLARPILLTLAGTLPVLAARAAERAGGSPVGAAAAATAAVAVGFGLVTVWLWKRDNLQAALRAQVARAGAGQS